jgi:hypothetical protein
MGRRKGSTNKDRYRQSLLPRDAELKIRIPGVLIGEMDKILKRYSKLGVTKSDLVIEAICRLLRANARPGEIDPEVLDRCYK